MCPESMDPFDEFQFKPITEGLGFHRKVKEPGQSMDIDEDKILSSTQFKARGLDLIEDEKPLDFKSPLPRKDHTENQKINEEELSPTSAAVDEILKNLGQNRKFDFKKEKNQKLKTTVAPTTATTAQKQNLVMAPVSLSAGILDSMLILAGSLLGFIVLLTVTEVDLLANLSHPQDIGLYLATASVFAGVSIVYYLTTRMVMGCSAGEWAYDQQLGTEKDHKDIFYGPLVVVRTIINLATGIVVLPILSSLMKKDLVGRMIGLEIYRKN